MINTDDIGQSVKSVVTSIIEDSGQPLVDFPGTSGKKPEISSKYLFHIFLNDSGLDRYFKDCAGC